MPTQTVTNTFSLFIRAKPEEVFAYVSDLTRHGEWNAGLRIEAVSTGPVRVGSQFRTLGKVIGQDRQNTLRVTEYQPPSRFCFASQDPGFGELLHEFTFQPQDGGTLMQRKVTSQMSAFMAWMLQTLIGPLVGNPQMDKAFKELRARLEKRAP